MGAINNSIKLDDHMSSTLRVINNTMEQTISIMQRLDRQLATLGSGGRSGGRADGNLQSLLVQMQMLEERVRSMGTDAGGSNSRIERMQNELNRAQTRINELEARLNAIGNNNGLNRAGDGARRAGENLSGAESKANGLLNRLKQLASVAVITIAVRFSFNTFAQFEQEMARVRAISGATAEEYQLLEDSARSLGRNTTFSATEAAQGMNYLAMAGWDTNQIIAAMPGMLNLAAAGAMELGQTADIVSDTMTAFGMRATEATIVADVFAKTITSTNTDIAMMGEAMKYAAPIAKQFGADIYQTSAMIGQMANAGIKASQAGTAMRSGLLRLADPRARAEMQLEKLGLSFTDTMGNMKDLQQIIRETSVALDNLSESERLAAAQRIFGVEASSGWLALFDQGSDALDEMVAQLQASGGAAQAMADTMNATLLGNLKLMASYAQDAMIEVGLTMRDALKAQDIGGAIIDGFRNAVDFVKGLVLSLTPAIVQIGVAFRNVQPILQTVFTMIGTTVNAIGATLGYIGQLVNGVLAPLAPVLAGLTAGFIAYKTAVLGLSIAKGIAATATAAWTAIQGVAAVVTHEFTAATTGATLAQLRLNLAMMANPAGLLIGLIAAVIGVLVYFAATNDGVAKAFLSAWYTVLNGIDQVGLGITNIFYGILNAIDQMVVGALGKLEGLINGAIGGLNKVSGIIQKFTGVELGQIGEVDLTSRASALSRARSNQRMDNFWQKQQAVTERANMRADKLANFGGAPLGGDVLKGLTDKLTAANTLTEGGTLASIGDVGKVGKIDDDVNIAEEDLKMLMELAVQNRVNQVNLTVQTAAPNITNNNTIASDVDAAGFIDALAYGLNESRLVTVDEVY